MGEREKRRYLPPFPLPPSQMRPPPWIPLLVVPLLLLATAAAGVFLLVGGLAPEDRAVLARVLSEHRALVFLFLFAVLAALGLPAAWFLKRHLLPLRRLTEEARLAFTAHAGHRLTEEGHSDLDGLRRALNALAERHETILDRQAEAVASARAALEEEHYLLAAVLSEVNEGILACTLDGRILLYNAAAVHLLETDTAPGLVGLGRSVFALLDHARLSHALKTLTASSPQQTERPAITLAIEQLAVRIRPLTSRDALPDGFLLVVTPTAVAPVVPATHSVMYDFALRRLPTVSSSLDDAPLTTRIYTVFDTETTGLRPEESDEIIALGAVRIVNGRLLREEAFDTLIDPRRTVPPAATRIHGLTAEDLQGQPTLDVVLPRFHRFAQESVLVAHNAAFDLGFLKQKEQRTGLRFDHPVLDTMLLSAVVLPAQEDHSLDALARRLGIQVVNRHSALGDALMTGAVFLKLLPLLAAHGIHTLGQAQEAARQTPLARLRY